MTHRPTTRSQQQLLVEAAKSVNLFCSELGQPFARIPLGADGQQVVPLYSDVFRNWLTYRFYTTRQKPPRRSALLDALSTLHAIAACEGPVGHVPTRSSSTPCPLPHLVRALAHLVPPCWEASCPGQLGPRPRRNGQTAKPDPLRRYGNPVASAVYNLLDGKAEWKGSATRLLDEFRRAYPAHPWPLTSKGLSQLVRRTNIKGVLMEFHRTSSRRTIRLSKIGDASCVFRPLNALRFPI